MHGTPVQISDVNLPLRPDYLGLDFSNAGDFSNFSYRNGLGERHRERFVRKRLAENGGNVTVEVGFQLAFSP